MPNSTGIKLQTEVDVAKEVRVICTYSGTGMPTLNFTDHFAVIRYDDEVAALNEKYRKLIEEGKA